uniref:Uncharacterized protein n=1 Tax=Anguilla anguilla TaxID=7936 RepID=A0A0E9UWV2_ANGAN
MDTYALLLVHVAGFSLFCFYLKPYISFLCAHNNKTLLGIKYKHYTSCVHVYIT